MKLAWYIRRLRVMGFRETFHRIYEQLFLLWLRFRQGAAEPPAQDVELFAFCTAQLSQLPELTWNFEGNRNQASSLLSGNWPALGCEWKWQGSDAWRLAPDTGSLWPATFFGSIPYRQGNLYGDIRVVWEPSRLQQLVSFALLAQEEPSRVEAVECFEMQLLSWVKLNRPYLGIHYVSAMECGLRLIAVCHATDMIRQHLQNPNDIWSAVVQLVESHADLVVRRLSLYSSAGNHTLAETAGLIYAGALFPEHKNATRWKRVGLALFEKESIRQFNADGGGIEQAFGYHLFVTDLVNLVAKLLDSKGEPNKRLQQIAENACEFLSELYDEGCRLPNIGDYDDGYALSPFLLSSKLRPASRQGVKVFDDSGYSVLQDSKILSRFILFDHGPLGMAPSYGHGHSDCLSVYWRENGRPLFVDAGTYTYTGDQRWREYFRGVSAHNTVSINGLDQASQQSAFMWSDPFQASRLDAAKAYGSRTVIGASHNGYEHLGIRHYRVIISAADGSVLVWDYLKALVDKPLANRASLWWHIGPEFELVDDVNPGNYTLERDGSVAISLEVTAGEQYKYRGDNEKPSGWYSPNYGEKLPIFTLEVRHSGSFPHEFYTYIQPSSANMLIDKSRFEQLVKKIRILCDE